MSNEALRLADELAGDQLYGLQRRCRDEAAALLRQQAERIAELEAERDQHKHTATSLLALLADIRMACGDNGKRMQPELVEFIGAMKAQREQLRAEVERLRADAERYRWLRDNLESEWAICEWQDDPDGLGYYRDARAPEFVDAAIDHARTTHKDQA